MHLHAEVCTYAGIRTCDAYESNVYVSINCVESTVKTGSGF